MSKHSVSVLFDSSVSIIYIGDRYKPPESFHFILGVADFALIVVTGFVHWTTIILPFLRCIVRGFLQAASGLKFLEE